jgi:hypothetical protein
VSHIIRHEGVRPLQGNRRNQGVRDPKAVGEPILVHQLDRLLDAVVDTASRVTQLCVRNPRMLASSC